MVASFPPGQARLCFVPAAFAGTAPDGARRLRIVIKISIPQSGRNAKPRQAQKVPPGPRKRSNKRQNCEAAKSQKQAEGNAPERRRPFWTPSGGNAASSPFLPDFAAKFPCAHSAKGAPFARRAALGRRIFRYFDIFVRAVKADRRLDFLFQAIRPNLWQKAQKLA